MLNDLQTQGMQKSSPGKAWMVYESIDYIFARQRLAVAMQMTKPIAPFEHERKDQLKNDQTGQSERLRNTGFTQQLSDLQSGK
ncbi:hypothetical protein PACILC2_14510 [Paenibacillus cisolokensis]|uniref:Uncharacterized protein n=1 Tax=Paenibacillus cisolokensis TaxID=1658519 RepID=A0ABQ4N3Y3_9BACL|nr:hypothetical protein PACILC2_14510 [Paenibacillus cisolokensis]